MSEAKRRAVLYGAGIAFAGALLVVGFGITVPPDPGVRLNGATLLAGMGRYDEALAVCATVLRDHPENLDARVFRATFLAMAERYDEAAAAYDDALAHVGEDEEMRRDLLLDRAGTLLKAGHLDAYRRERDRLAEMGSDHRVLLLEGLAAEQDQDWDAAVQAYREAHAARSDDQQIRARLWNALMEQGRAALAARRFATARDAFDAARPLFPAAAQAHLKAIEVRLAMDDPLDALRCSREVGPRTPGIAPLVFRAATTLLETGDERTAFLALEGAFGADPQGTQALFDQEPAWQARRGDPEVRRILETRQNAGEGRLPPPEPVIDSEGTAPIGGDSHEGGRNTPDQ
ncbi:MAG: tetratricopeptide repeat protein [Planctomycetota bacterium]|jgi:tetratricopeptide (TPR) repeat protein